MMQAMRDYLMCVCIGSILLSLLQTLLPEGKYQKVLDFSGSIMLLLIVISPVVNLDASEILGTVSEYLNQDYKVDLEIVSNNQERIEQVIIDSCATYILDKAEMIGADITVVVRLDVKDNVPYPTGVELSGAYNDQQKQILSNILEQELGIPKEEQKWRME